MEFDNEDLEIDIDFMKHHEEFEPNITKERVERQSKQNPIDCYKALELMINEDSTEVISALVQPILRNKRLAKFFLEEWEPFGFEFLDSLAEIFKKVYYPFKVRGLKTLDIKQFFETIEELYEEILVE